MLYLKDPRLRKSNPTRYGNRKDQKTQRLSNDTLKSQRYKFTRLKGLFKGRDIETNIGQRRQRDLLGLILSKTMTVTLRFPCLKNLTQKK